MVACCTVGRLGGSVGANSFGCFLGGFGWFLLVEDNFGLFQVVFCFSSYTNFTAYRRVNSLLYSWLKSFNFFIQSKTTRKRSLFFLVAYQSQNELLFPIFYCILCQMKNFFWGNFLNKQSQNTSGGIARYLIRGALSANGLKNFQKHGDYWHSRGGAEI